MGNVIAWIEDDTDIIDPVVSLLEREGHRFIRIRSIGEALDRVDIIRNCDLILLDVILPQGQADRQYTRYAGKDLLRELRQQHGVTTPVVVLSVVSNAEVQRELESLQVSDIVKKPVLPSKLRERVERVLASAAQ